MLSTDSPPSEITCIWQCLVYHLCSAIRGVRALPTAICFFISALHLNQGHYLFKSKFFNFQIMIVNDYVASFLALVCWGKAHILQQPQNRALS